MEFHIHPCTRDSFAEMTTFIARMNAHPDHNISYLGDHLNDIQVDLLALNPPPEEGFFIARTGDQICGVFGVEFDAEIGRAWLFGPIVDAQTQAAWDWIARELLITVLPILPPEITLLEIYCDIRNTRVQNFAQTQGFSVYKPAAYMKLLRDHTLKTQANPIVEPLLPGEFPQFEAIHNAAFPGTYYTARQLLEMQNEQHTLLTAHSGGEVVGYIFYKSEPETGEGYIDFLAVVEKHRGKGFGAALLQACIANTFSDPAMESIGLTVNPENQNAVRLYENNGFFVQRNTISFRRKVA